MPPTAPTIVSHKGRGLVIAVVLLSVFLLLSLGFGIWSFSSRQDYKNNVDKKISEASEKVKLETSSEKDKEFTETQKNPLKHYKGPSTYGSVDIQYPKTWSAYIDQSGSGISPLSGYMHPDFVPGTQSGVAFALRIQVVNVSYAQEIRQFDSKVKIGKVKISPFTAAKVPGVLGSRVDGEINLGQKDSRVLIPVRDKTLEISTESDQYLSDFNNIILPNLVFSP